MYTYIYFPIYPCTIPHSDVSRYSIDPRQNAACARLVAGAAGGVGGRLEAMSAVAGRDMLSKGWGWDASGKFRRPCRRRCPHHYMGPTVAKNKFNQRTA